MDLETTVAGLARRVLGYAVLRTGDPALAEEVAQESLAALVHRWRRHGPPRSPEGFVFAVARRRAARALLRRRLWLPLERLRQRHDDRLDPESRLIQHDERARLASALARLKNTDRGLLLLLTVGEMPVAAAAALVGVSPAAVPEPPATSVFVSAPSRGPADIHRRVFLDVNEAAPAQVLAELARAISARLELDPQVQRRVTLHVSNVTATTALDAICESIGCRWTLKEENLLVRAAAVPPPLPARERLMQQLQAPLPAGWRFEGVPLGEALDAIAKETGIRIDSGNLDRARPVTVDVSGDSPLPAVMKVVRASGQTTGGLSLYVDRDRTARVAIESSEHYFSLLSIPLLMGRGFTNRDTAASSPVVVVNEAFALVHWKSVGDAINRQISVGGQRGFTVVGVAADARDGPAWAPPQPTVYVPFRQAPWSSPETRFTILLHATGTDPAALVVPLRGTVAALDPYQPLSNVLTLDRIVSAQFAAERVVLVTMSVFGVLTLLLAAIGMHGVMAYAVVLRRQEVGIRLAVGGSRRAVLGLLFRRAAAVNGLGLGVGLPVAIVLAVVLRSQLLDIAMSDVVLCLASGAAVSGASLCASLAPALRAVRQDPLESLRSE